MAKKTSAATTEWQSITSSHLTSDQEVLYAFEDIINLPTGYMEQFASAVSGLFYTNYAQFAQYRQKVHQALLNLKDGIDDFTKLVSKQKLNLSELKAEAEAHADNMEIQDNVRDFEGELLFRESALTGFNNIFSREYQFGYERNIALAFDKDKVGDAATGLKELLVKINQTQTKINAYSSENGEFKLQHMLLEFSDDKQYDVTIASDFRGAVDDIHERSEYVSNLVALLDELGNYDTFMTRVEQDCLVNSSTLKELRALKQDDFDANRTALDLYLKGASPTTMIATNSPETEIMVEQAAMIFERDDWNNTWTNIMDTMNSPLKKLDRDIYKAAEQNTTGLLESETDINRMQRIFVDLGMMMGMIQMGLQKTKEQSVVAETEYRDRLLQISRLKIEREDLRTRIQAVGAEASTADQERLDFLQARLPKREERLEAMDMSYERTQLATLSDLFDNLNGEFITLRNEGWDDPGSMIARYTTAYGGPLVALYVKCKGLLYDMHFLSSSFKAQGKRVKDLEADPAKVAELNVQTDAAKEGIAATLGESELKSRLLEQLEDMESSIAFSEEIGNRYETRNTRRNLGATLGNVQAVLAMDNITDLVKDAEEINDRTRQTIIRINMEHDSAQQSEDDDSVDLQPFFQSYKTDADILIQYSDDLVVRLFTERRKPERLLQDLERKEQDATSILSNILQLKNHYSTPKSTEFLKEVKIVKARLKQIDGQIKELVDNFYDPSVIRSYQKKLAVQQTRFDQLLIESRTNLSSAHNTLSKKWFSRSVKGKLETVHSELLPRVSEAIGTKDLEFGVETKFKIFASDTVRVQFDGTDSPATTYEIQYLDHHAATQALEQYQSKKSWYKTNPHKKAIKKLQGLMNANPNIHPELIRQEITDRIVKPANKQISEINAGNDEGAVKTSAIEGIIGKSNQEITTYIESQTVGARALQGAASKVLAKNIVEGVRLATSIGLAIARLVVSSGLDVFAWIKLFSSFASFVAWLFKIIRGLMVWFKYLSKELIKLHTNMTNTLQEGIKSWLKNAFSSTIQTAATITPQSIDGIPLGTLLSAARFMTIINGSLTTTRKTFQNTQAALNAALNSLGSFRSQIQSLLDKIDEQKKALDGEAGKTVPAAEKAGFLTKIAQSEGKLMELLEQGHAMSTKVGLGRGMTTKASKDITLYENFLTRTCIPSSIAEDPDSILKHLMIHGRFAQSTIQSVEILESKEFYSFSNLGSDLNGIWA